MLLMFRSAPTRMRSFVIGPYLVGVDGLDSDRVSVESEVGCNRRPEVVGYRNNHCEVISIMLGARRHGGVEGGRY